MIPIGLYLLLKKSRKRTIKESFMKSLNLLKESFLQLPEGHREWTMIHNKVAEKYGNVQPKR